MLSILKFRILNKNEAKDMPDLINEIKELKESNIMSYS